MPPRKPDPEPDVGQIALFALREAPDAFKKAVQVVHSQPKAPLSLLQRKLGNAWLKNAVENPPDPAGWWEIGIRQLSRTIGFDSNNREYLKESAEALMRVVHEWDVLAPAGNRVQWKASVLFPEIEIRQDVFRYQISSQMRDRLIDPDVYAVIDMTVVRRFRRAPSLAIWELCVRFEKIGRTAEIGWEKLRDMALGESAEAKTYQEYKYFKAKVLKPAIAEINSESNHTITLVERKDGKRVTSLRFEIQRKGMVQGPQEPTTPDDIELVAELATFRVPASEAQRLVKQHPAAAVRAALEYTRRRMKDSKSAPLANPAAYFRQALVGRYAEGQPVAKVAPTVKPAQQAAVDLREAYLAHWTAEAERYFAELDPADRDGYVERYNAKQTSGMLRLGKRTSRLAVMSFHRWLAVEVWGEPDEEALLAFAAQALAKPSQA
jgi:hypothetical protein